MTTQNEFQAIAERMQEKARERGDVEGPQVEAKQAEILQFPLWPEPERGMPNAMLRSALFAVVKKGTRRHMKREHLASWPDTELAYTGEQLDQYDEDVWMDVTHRHHLQGVLPGRPLHINAKARNFMRDFGRARGVKTAAAYYDSIVRMEACGVHITQNIAGQEVEYTGSLVSESARVKGTELWAVVLNPRLLAYFAPGHYSRIAWETRRALSTDLARWLHGYVSTHQATTGQPHRIGLERLHDLSGSTNSLKDFRWKLKRAMGELERARIVLAWSITPGDALEFARPRTARGPQKNLAPKW